MDLFFAFAIGVLTAVASLFLEISVSILFPFLSPPIDDTTWASLPFSQILLMLLPLAVIEELMKYIGIRKLWEITDAKASIIFLSLFVGIGFSSVEIALNIVKHGAVLPFPFLGVISIHVATTFLLGLSFLFRNKIQYLVSFVALLLAILLHLGYNLYIAIY
jgi:hypothetical protein